MHRVLTESLKELSSTPMSTTQPELNERAQQLLKLLIERYISDGQPVGSRALSREKGLNLSPATIRNVMADLEEMGLIQSPHTSAGRVPTVNGYRVFVDSLLTVHKIDAEEVERFREHLDEMEDQSEVITAVSRLLSGVTSMASVVTLPKRETSSFRQIEFMPLSHRRLLVILVTNEKEVHNRIIHTQRDFKPSELQQAANYLNSIFQGQSLAQVKDIIRHEMTQDRERMNRLMIDAINLAHQSMDDNRNKDEGLVFSGETNLMDFQDLSNMDQLRHLFEAFNQKQGIMHLLDRCLEADGVQIFIGEESGYEAFGNCSLVTAPYTVDDQVIGVLGVIGPTRMSYNRVIPFVDVTARILGSALKYSH